MSYKGTVAVLLAATIVIGGLVSLVASSNPDGLEWSMEQVAGTAELEAEGRVYEAAGQVQEATAVLPDYGWKNSDSVTGTSFSGLLGGGVVIALCVAGCYLLKLFRGREKKQ